MGWRALLRERANRNPTCAAMPIFRVTIEERRTLEVTVKAPNVSEAKAEAWTKYVADQAQEVGNSAEITGVENITDEL